LIKAGRRGRNKLRDLDITPEGSDPGRPPEDAGGELMAKF
jgi:hypothetical protein